MRNKASLMALMIVLVVTLACGLSGRSGEETADATQPVAEESGEAATAAGAEESEEPTAAPTAEPMESGVNRPGQDYCAFDLREADPSVCQSVCDQSPFCKAWTYVKPDTGQGPNPRCWLKEGIPAPVEADCCVSGVKGETALARPTPSRDPQETALRAVDGMEMVVVPGGDFPMGDNTSVFPPEKPGHLVTVDAFWIDRLEVSNAQYRLCVEDGTCAEPRSWADANFNADDQPALVPWESAATYCEWAGGRLPTEAEWEKAARGPDGRRWPWGIVFEGVKANLSGQDDGYGFTAPVGSFPGDVSPFGLLDMAGNAAEWVSDWWDPEYYAKSPTENPTGPASGEQKVHRAPIAHGGGGPEKSRCVARYASDPSEEQGFRCVASAPPSDEARAPSSDDGAPTGTAEAMPAAEEPVLAPETDVSGMTAGDWPSLESYRMRAIQVSTIAAEDVPEQDVEEDVVVEQEFIFDWNGAIPASRTVVACMEEITVGDTRWTKASDGPWVEETLTAEEQATWEQQWSLAQFWGIEEDLEASLPEDVFLVPGQIFPLPIKAAMVFDGEETVNEVPCRRYTVDTNLDYDSELGHTTGHAKGAIWVAHHDSLPPVVVRTQMDEDLTIGDGPPTHTLWDVNMLDINQPVTIEPPEE